MKSIANIEELKNVTGFVHHTESFGAVDGPGIRYVFFLQGCSLRCLYCHNPDAIPPCGGARWTAEQVAREAVRYKNFIRDGGVTFSGGEPLMQPEFVRAATVLLHREGLHVAIDTAGAEPLEKTQGAIDEADLLLLDIKAVDPDICKRLTGRDSTNAFKTLDYCESIGKPVWMRHVLVQGYTLDDAQLKLLAHKLKPYKCIERIELLPFHKLGEPKWENLGRPYMLLDTPATTMAEVEHAKEILRQNGCNI